MPFFGTKKKVAMAQAGERKAQVDAGAAKLTKAVAMKKPVKVVEKAARVAVTAPVLVPNVANTSAASVVIRPHITEKSGLLSQNGVYTFQITTRANKAAVAKAMKALYKVIPVKIAITNNPAKNVFIRGKKGTVPGVRKAVVTLKKGDKIDFV